MSAIKPSDGPPKPRQKLFDFSPADQANRIGYLKDDLKTFAQALGETKDRVLGYVFGLNAGGLVAGAAYASEHKGPISAGVSFAIGCFGVGLLAVVLRAAFDYYACERMFKERVAITNKFFLNTAYWDEVEEVRKQHSSMAQWPFHGFGWAGGILFFLGLLIGLLSIICGGALPAN